MPRENVVAHERKSLGSAYCVGWAKRQRAHHQAARLVMDGGHVAGAPLPTLLGFVGWILHCGLRLRGLEFFGDAGCASACLSFCKRRSVEANSVRAARNQWLRPGVGSVCWQVNQLGFMPKARRPC